jgi:hypothetical protein
VNLDIHPFKCSGCKGVTPHRLVRTYDCQEVPDAPPEVWLVECQRCFEMRIIYPSERLASKEDDILRCAQCGNWKMKAAKCRVCRLAAGEETIKRKIFTGHSDLLVDDEIGN